MMLAGGDTCYTIDGDLNRYTNKTLLDMADLRDAGINTNDVQHSYGMAIKDRDGKYTVAVVREYKNSTPSFGLR